MQLFGRLLQTRSRLRANPKFDSLQIVDFIRHECRTFSICHNEVANHLV